MLGISTPYARMRMMNPCREVKSLKPIASCRDVPGYAFDRTCQDFEPIEPCRYGIGDKEGQFP